MWLSLSFFLGWLLTTGGGGWHNAQTKAHCYYTIVRNFANAVEKVEDKQLQAVLHKLCMLFALYQVQRDLGDFTCSGYLAQCVPRHDTTRHATRHTRRTTQHDTHDTRGTVLTSMVGVSVGSRCRS